MRWEVKDENLDLKSLVVEYQVEGVGVWRRVPIKRPKLIGGQQWDAGTAEALKVRASVADKAGNVAEAAIELPEGTASPSRPGHDRSRLTTCPPGISQVADGRQLRDHGRPRLHAGEPRPWRKSESNVGIGATSRSIAALRTASRSARSARSAGSDWDRERRGSRCARGRALRRRIRHPRIFSPIRCWGLGSRDVGRSRAGFDAIAWRARAAAARCWSPTRDSSFNTRSMTPGPSGPATVELWITQDGGRTWIRRGDDPDRVSPIEVDLGGEGTYGLCLVARSASGLGDQPPAPGDPPQSWVEVDSTPPAVQLPAASGRNRCQLRQGGDRLAGQRSSPAAQVCFALVAARSARAPSGRRSPMPRKTPDNSSGPFPPTCPPALSSQGRGRRFRRPSRLGRNDRHGADHRRSQPASQPDHRS